LRIPFVLVCLVAALALPSQAHAQDPFIAESPDEIRPLLIGADIPDVTLATVDREPVELRRVLAKKPTILIYYRGGW
jgi:hypothetical protein